MKNKNVTLSCLLMSLSASFLLAGYELVRSASNSLFKASFGSEHYSTVLMLVPFVVLLAIVLYTKCLNKYGPQKTLTLTSLFSAGVLGACYFLFRNGYDFSTAIIILYREVYIVLLVEQLWSFINTIVNSKQARKINGMVLALSTMGALAGDFTVYHYAKALGTHTMLLFSILCFLPSCFLANMAYNSSAKISDKINKPHSSKQKQESKSFKETLGLSLFKTEPVLIVIMGLIIASQVYITLTSINFQTILHQEIPNIDEQTSYSGLFFARLNMISLTLQIIVVPILLNFIPLYLIHLCVPVINVIFMLIAFYTPSLETVGMAFIVFKAMDYSIFRAAKEILYIPLSFDAKFRSKELIDVLGYRGSKGLSSFVISLVQNSGYLISSALFSFSASIFAIIWLGFAIPIVKLGSKKEKEKLQLKLADQK